MTDEILTPTRSGASFGRITPSPLAEDVAAVPPSLPQAAVGLATSTAGNLIARSPLPWPVKALVVVLPLLFMGWRWVTRGSRKP